MVQLSVSELTEVNAKRLAFRPVRYDDGLGSWVQVTEDFETFLILTPIAKKAQAVNWINVQQLGLEGDSLRDIVVNDFLLREIAEATLPQETLSLVTDLYEDFRAEFVQGRFAGIAEVVTLMEDTRLGADRLFTENDELEHRIVAATAVQERYSNDGTTDGRRLQASSWVTPLMTPYL